MLRRNRRFLVLVSLLALIASALALRTDHEVARIPGDLVQCETDAPWLYSSDTYPLPDNSERTLQREADGVLRLTRPPENVATHFHKPIGRLLGITSDFRAVVAEISFPSPRPRDGKITLSSTGIGEHLSPSQSTTLLLPKTVQTLEDAVLSPDSQQIAWYFTSRYERPGIALLRRIAPGLAERFPPHRLLEVWVSDTKGGQLRTVAALPESLPDGWHAPPTPSSVLYIGWSQKTSKLMVAHTGKHYRLP
ncbi:hypothetical protein [Armatimonas sp.]|uniref:hypothetical protein n=1 Tax=Armatimonas sp. TaxID=1872638 RepID=UPI0037501172